MVIYGDVGKQTSLPFKEIHIYILRSQWVLLFYGYCIHICVNNAFTWCFDLKTQLFNIFLHAEIPWGDFFHAMELL